MAYPTTPISFTVKNAGDTIQPAHVNDLQTEVTAIEQGLLVGIAHNLIPNADNTRTFGSSAARWIIDGSQIKPSSLPSTCLSTSGTASTSTFYRGDGSWASPAGSAREHVCKVGLVANQAVSSGVWTGITWDSEEYDQTGMHSTSVNSSRITMAGSSGVYTFGANITIQESNPAVAAAAIRFLLNDTTALAGPSGFGTIHAAGNLSAALTAAKLITSTSDYVTVQFIAAAGSTFVSTACSFWAHKVTD